MTLNLLGDESLEQSEPVNCIFISGVDAVLAAQKLGLPDLEIIKKAIQIADSDFNLNTIYNKARFMARWGKIAEQITLLCKKSGTNWEFHNDSQPRLENLEKKVQIIFMSGNIAIGKQDEVISASYPKGYSTLKNIKANQSSYDDETKLRTWILYFPPTSHPAYSDSSIAVPFEISYPTSFVQTPVKSKLSIFPKDHSCRIAFEMDNPLPVKIEPKPVMKPSSEIKPDDFDIQLVV